MTKRHFYPRAAISWSERDMVWLRAAVTLPAYDFLLAIEDIAGMSGRTIGAVAQKAKIMRREAHKALPPKPPSPVTRIPHKRLRARLVARAKAANVVLQP